MKKILLLTVLLSISSFAFAAFPVTDPIPESITKAAEPLIYEDSPWPNIVSLASVLLAMLLPVEFAILALVLFIAGIVFGSMGFSRRLKGMGIAGFVVGILGLIGVVILSLAVDSDPPVGDPYYYY